MLPWVALFGFYQTGLLGTAIAHADRAWSHRDPEGLSFGARVSLELLRSGDCDLAIQLQEWVHVGATHAPDWIRAEAIGCLDDFGRIAEATELASRYCAAREVDERPHPVFRPHPYYTRDREGWVELSFDLGAAGRVTQARVTASHPPLVFDDDALAAVERWRYCPGPVASDQRVRLTFEP